MSKHIWILIAAIMVMAGLQSTASASQVDAPVTPQHAPELPPFGPNSFTSASGQGGIVVAIPTVDCTGDPNPFVQLAAGEPIVEIVLENDPANLAGPNSDRLRWRAAGDPLTTVVSFRACLDVFITSGEGDEVVTVKTLDASTAIQQVIIRTQGFDFGTLMAFDEPGEDTVVFEASTTPVDAFVLLNNGDDFLSVAPTYSGNILEGRGGAGADRLTGGSGTDFFYGEGGADTIIARGGNDRAEGGPGNDTINLGGGDDWTNGDAGNDDIKGGGGKDTLNGGAGNDELQGQGAADSIFGQEDNDTLDGQNGGDTINGGPGDDVMRGQTGPDEMIGAAGDDTMSGGNGNDTLTGNAGFDRCSGNTGPNDMAHAASCEQTPGVESFF